MLFAVEIIAVKGDQGGCSVGNEGMGGGWGWGVSRRGGLDGSVIYICIVPQIEYSAAGHPGNPGAV